MNPVRLWPVAVWCGAVAFAAPAFAQSPHPGGYGGHPPMPGQKFLVRAWIDDGAGKPVVEETLQLGASVSPAELSQSLLLPPAYGSVRLLRFLPAAELQQSVVTAEGEAGTPALEIAIEGPTQTFRRWLIAGDPQRDRMVSYIATWRFAVVLNAEQRSELFRQFETELARDPVLTLLRADRAATETLVAREGESRKFPSLDCEVRVLKFFPHFARKDESKEPVNVSNRRVNPAALIEITLGARLEQRWIFAKFPSYSAGSLDDLPIVASLDCPQESERSVPDIVIASIPDEGHEVWVRHAGRIERTATALQVATAIPASQYSFKLTSYVAAGRLAESYVPSASGKGPAAVRFTWQPPEAAPLDGWVEVNKSRTLASFAGRLTLSLAMAEPGDKAGHP